MKLLVILLLTLIYKNWSGGNPVRDRIPFSLWHTWLSKQHRLTHNSGLLMGVFVGIPLVVVGLIDSLFAEWFTLILLQLLALSLLVYCLKDWEDVENRLQQPFDKTLSPEALYKTGQNLGNELTLSRFSNLFAPLVWYLLAGPFGLIFYILCVEFHRLSENEEEQSLANDVLFYLDWLPARLTVLMFTVTGNFTHTFSHWLDTLMDVRGPLDEMLIAGARTAVNVRVPDPDTSENLEEDLEMELEELALLHDRTLWAYVGLAAVITLIGF
ncbi:MAG: regulatory signaling modulator protein AmpE [Gammaproteobacteria bacterium]|nr:regulatory signaling modulator protein AmpE [Gammaproteobacteria bacterium]